MSVEKEKIVKTFFDLVKIDSPTGEEDKVMDYLKTRFKKLGFKKNREIFEDVYGNLIIQIPGRGGGVKKKSLILNDHTDTVEPGRGIKPVIKGDKITSQGKTILGADPKAGVTEILEAVEYLEINQIDHPPLELIFTRGEETDLLSSRYIKRGEFLKLKNSKKKLKLKSQSGLTLDGGVLGEITLASPYILDLEITVIGKKGHIISDIQKAKINSIIVTAKALAKIKKTGLISKNTTLNIGNIQGGSNSEMIPYETKIEAEVRSYDFKKIKLIEKYLKDIFEKTVKANQAKFKFKAHLHCSGYKHSKNKFIQKIIDNFKNLKIKPYFEYSMYNTDVNQFNKNGFKLVNVSCGVVKNHTTDETVKISDIEKITNFLINFLKI